MQKNTLVYGVLLFIIVCLGVGAFVRYEVVKDRNHPDAQLITDFSSCLSAQGDLDVTGTICTTLAGVTFIKPGATPPSPITPSTQLDQSSSTTTTSTTTNSTTTITTTTTVPSPKLALNVKTTFLINDSKTLPNGTIIKLTGIQDSRCKPNVQCIWAGELSALWSITTGTATDNFSLGAVRTLSTTKNNYHYTLLAANEKGATLVVTPTTTSSI